MVISIADFKCKFYLDTERPKIYRKTVPHLLKYTANLYVSRCSTNLR